MSNVESRLRAGPSGWEEDAGHSEPLCVAFLMWQVFHQQGPSRRAAAPRAALEEPTPYPHTLTVEARGAAVLQPWVHGHGSRQGRAMAGA